MAADSDTDKEEHALLSHLLHMCMHARTNTHTYIYIRICLNADARKLSVSVFLLGLVWEEWGL